MDKKGHRPFDYINFFRPSTDKFEQLLVRLTPFSANTLSWSKLYLITPIFFIFLIYDPYPNLTYPILLSLFLFFMFLDYLDGLVAKLKGQVSFKGALIDRITDYPLLLIISWQVHINISTTLLLSKLSLDLILIIIYTLKKTSTHFRSRSGINYITLICMLFLGKGLAIEHINREVVEGLLLLNIAYTASIGLTGLGIIGKFLIADLLSFLNFLCGLASIYFSYNNQFQMALLFLLIGAAFDGLDGAAARRWGGTRWGIYSDDIADGVNYGLAPAFALYFFLPSPQGITLGLFFAFFTIFRLIFFTLNKNSSDPNFFSGVPSTMGGILVLCGLILFSHYQAIIGLIVGVAMIQMVSFDSHYRHLGRAISDYRGPTYIALPTLIILLVISFNFFPVKWMVIVLFSFSLLYGLSPTMKAFKNVLYDKSKQTN